MVSEFPKSRTPIFEEPLSDWLIAPSGEHQLVTEPPGK